MLFRSDDTVASRAIFEVLSPSTALTDRRVKAIEYAAVPTVMVYVLLENRPEITIRRRSTDWEAESLTGIDAMLDLPEIGITIPLAFIYDAA